VPEPALPLLIPVGTSETPPSPASAKELIATHFAFVWRLLRRLGLPNTDADDAAQQVFLVACTKLDQIQSGRERAFLYGCALNQWSKWRAGQRRSRSAVDLDDLGVEHALAHQPDAEHHEDLRRARVLLDQILGELSSDLRSVFVLYELEQLTTFEIADLLQLPRGTVSSRLRRAREEFEKRVARAGRATHQRNGL
jgi:RNA polymerase sigma-70 factor, ECF subfamily